MIRWSGLILVVAAFLIFAFQLLPITFYLSHRTERLSQLWTQDLQTLLKNKEASKLLNNVQDYELGFSDPQVHHELETLSYPLKTNSQGPLILSIEITRWIHGNQYGYLLQHDFFDTSSGEPEKIYEFSRNYKIGFFW